MMYVRWLVAFAFLANLIPLAHSLLFKAGRASPTRKRCGSPIASCFALKATKGNPGMQGGEEKPEVGFGEGIVGSSKDKGDIPEEIRIANLPKMERGLVEALRKTVGELLSSKAVSTTSHYMKEFRNDADQRWMCSYKGFHTHAFGAVFQNGEKRSEWTDWIESMIKSDKLEIQVLMNPPPPFPSSSSSMKVVHGPVRDVDTGMRIEYMHQVEPRKIANQLLVVRESISKEVLDDLQCIRLENIEAVRYAKVKVHMGEEEAIRTRKLTRTSTIGGDSTPLRDRTYHDLSVICSNFALHMVSSSGDAAVQQYIGAYLSNLEKQESARSVSEQSLHEYVAPMEMLEDLHYRGLIQQHDTTSLRSSSVCNILRLSQSLLDYRYAVSLEVKRIVAEDDSLTRQYYKLIKDCGGFKKFDLEGKGSAIRLVNLHAEPGDEMYPTAPRNSPTMDLSAYGDGVVKENTDAEKALDDLKGTAGNDDGGGGGGGDGSPSRSAIAVISDDEEGTTPGPFIM
jgi:hypothetical protein